MKAKINTKVLLDALTSVLPFSPAKAPIAILKYAKITSKGDRMKIEANDTTMGGVKYFRTEECDEDTSFLVELVPFAKFVGKVKSESVELTVEDTTVKIRHNKGTAEFATSSPTEFPVFKAEDSESTAVFLPASIIRDFIGKGKNFAAADTLRPHMCALYMYCNNGEVGFCSTDTRKLITSSKELNCGSELNWLIPSTVFSALSKVCSGADNVDVHVSPTHVIYRAGDTIVQVCQPNGKYPDFRRVIPHKSEMECTVDRNEMMDSLNRLSLFGGDSQCLKLNISQMDLNMACDNLDRMEKSSETITHSGCTGEITIGVNAQYLLTGLSTFSEGDIQLKLTSPSHPIIITSEADKGQLVLVMPMTISNA